VDNGDLFAPKQKHPELTVELVAKSMHRMGYDAINLGELDLLLGEHALRTLASPASPRLVSTNLEGPVGRWQPYLLKEVAGVKIAVLGIVSPALAAKVPFVKARPPEEVLRSIVPRVRAQADLCVLLSHMTRQETLELLSRVPGIDVAIVGHGFRKFEPQKIGDTIVAAASYKGEFVGVLTLDWNPHTQRIDGFEGRLILLEPHIPDDQPTRALVNDYEIAVDAEVIRQQIRRTREDDAMTKQLRETTPGQFVESLRRQQETRQK